MTADKLVRARALADKIEAALAQGDNAEGLIMRFVDEDGMRWTKHAWQDRLEFSGVSATCTAGPHGLLHNWIHAVRRKCDKEGR